MMTTNPTLDLPTATTNNTTKPKRKRRPRIRLTRKEVAIIRSFPDVRWYDELLPSE